MLMKMMLFPQLLHESSLQKLELDSLHLKFLNIFNLSTSHGNWMTAFYSETMQPQNFGHFEIALFCYQEHVGQFGNPSIELKRTK